MEQIEIMFDRLMVDAAIRDVLSQKGQECSQAPYSNSEDPAQEEEIVYSTACSFLMDDQAQFEGCSVLEQIMRSYDAEVVSVFFDQGTCSDFTLKYQEIAFHELQTEQMQIVFQNLGIGSGV